VSAVVRAPLIDLEGVLPAVPPVVRAIAAYGLEAPHAPPFPGGAVDDEEWTALWRAVDEQRLWGLTSAALADGVLVVGERRAAEVVAGHEEAVAACLRLDRQLEAVAAGFVAAGVEFRVLKGVAAACCLYDQPGVRLYGDVDLLVRGEDFDRAAGVVVGLGGERHHGEPHVGFVARFGKSAAFSLPGGWEVDLHRTFGLGPFGVAAGSHDLLGAGWPVDLRGFEVEALEPEPMLVGAAFHAVLGGDVRRLLPLRDVAELLRPGRVDPTTVVALAERWGVTAVLAAGVEAATRELGLASDSVLAVWAGEYEPSRRERRWLDDAHDGGPGVERRRVRALLEALPSATDRLAFLRATFWYPGAPSMADRVVRFSRGIGRRAQRSD